MARSKATFFPLSEVTFAAILWFGKADLDTMCLAENRLNREADQGQDFRAQDAP